MSYYDGNGIAGISCAVRYLATQTFKEHIENARIIIGWYIHGFSLFKPQILCDRLFLASLMMQLPCGFMEYYVTYQGYSKNWDSLNASTSPYMLST